ncbi:hypothetical protein DFW101_1885 [Solidesulfovibrio carbinoliphilus subsp. oakridgensis]|uniref:PIN domain-containing protein n=1 Tax=Solidesulfovibrio carbinoliphilus subsp. oakridgensis TaxID=694327 RepID=G7Q4W5_9BACT|nr:hypothetical protein [Solidesulfovibrio carbinoliphilus]EHJ47892.1 hypothetical protein DFW101_1885 [Solidesulfovibrio carbinoliphilus subsp. oakridgensis]
MGNKISKAIVIDASVAQSAGGTDHPVSRLCREFLEAVLVICHRMAANPELLAEWNKHRSRFSSTWLTAMVRKGKLVRLPEAGNKELWSAFGGGDCPEKDYRNISKDLHLIDAAMQTDGRVASLDEAVRGSLRNCLEQQPEIGKIAWVNPANEAEKAVEWLQTGALAERPRLLRSFKSPAKASRKTKA